MSGTLHETTSGLPNPQQRPEWLARHQEPVIEPERVIIDAHHHLWDGEHPRYLLDEILADVRSGHAIDATVFVEAKAMYRRDGPDPLKCVGEVEFANGIAAMNASGRYGPTRLCAAIVGHADLRLGSGVEALLEALERAGGGRFRGIRHIAARDPEVRMQAPPGLFGDLAFREGFARLQQLGYSFDAWLYHPQLHELIDLMQAFPSAKVVLNHLGGRIGVGSYASNKDEVMRSWRQDLHELARFPYVNVKLGGLGMALAGFGFHHWPKPPTSDDLVREWRPYVETGVEVFGPDRCMFESNFPVDKASCSYGALWNAFKKIVSDMDEHEKDKLFRSTAANFYKI